MSDPENPLSRLLTSDADSIDLESIAEFLNKLVKIDEKSQKIAFLQNFHKISSNDNKIKILLLASKARSLLLKVDEGFLPSEIIDIDIMPGGSVKTALKRLSDSHVIKKNASGKYYIPNYNVSEVITSIQAKSKG